MIFVDGALGPLAILSYPIQFKRRKKKMIFFLLLINMKKSDWVYVYMAYS